MNNICSVCFFKRVGTYRCVLPHPAYKYPSSSSGTPPDAFQVVVFTHGLIYSHETHYILILCQLLVGMLQRLKVSHQHSYVIVTGFLVGLVSMSLRSVSESHGKVSSFP